MITLLALVQFGCSEAENPEVRCWEADYFETLDADEHAARAAFCDHTLTAYNVDRKLRMPFYDALMRDPERLMDGGVCATVLADLHGANASIALYATYAAALYKARFPDREPSCVEYAFPDGPPVAGWVPRAERVANPGHLRAEVIFYLEDERRMLERELAAREQRVAELPVCAREEAR